MSECCECVTPINGEVFRIVHDDSGSEVGRLCGPCESDFSQKGFNTSVVEGE